MYYAYILKSEKDGSYYYGHTSNLAERIKAHNFGRTRSTKSKRPWKLHYSEEYATKSEAYKRELYFKSLAGYHWLKEQEII